MDKLCCDFRVLGPVQTNCYFVYQKDSKECLIFDPGDQAGEIISYVKKKELKPVGIVLTHGHFDHIMAADEVRKEFCIKIYAAKAEEELLGNSMLNVSAQIGASVSLKADEWLEDGQELSVLGETMRCILTPGHTIGGMCYYFPKSELVISGDTLFEASVGRTDLPTGNGRQLIQSIREKLFCLPDEVRVYPGHGMMTSIKEEKMYNPFAAE